MPKLQAFYRVKMKEKRDEQQQQEKSNNTTSRPSVFSFLKSSHNQTYFDHRTSHSNSPGISELLSLEQILASDEPVLDDDDNSLRRRKPSAVSTTLENIDGGSSNFIEVHEGEMPIRKVFRYFPFLSQWEMHYVMVFPWLGYFSHFSVSRNFT